MATWNGVDVASEPHTWRADFVGKMASSSKAIIVTETAPSGKIIACNAAWNALCEFPPEEALDKNPRLLQGKLTSKRKARQYAREVHACSILSEDDGFAARQAIAHVKLVNYTKSGRPFVHCLRSRRLMDESTGKDYFVTESSEEKDPAICRAMLGDDAAEPGITGNVQGAGLALIATALMLALLPASLQAVELGLILR